MTDAPIQTDLETTAQSKSVDCGKNRFPPFSLADAHESRGWVVENCLLSGGHVRLTCSALFNQVLACAKRLLANSGHHSHLQ
jgi:hypothetical protein